MGWEGEVGRRRVLQVYTHVRRRLSVRVDFSLSQVIWRAGSARIPSSHSISGPAVIVLLAQTESLVHCQRWPACSNGPVGDLQVFFFTSHRPAAEGESNSIQQT